MAETEDPMIIGHRLPSTGNTTVAVPKRVIGRQITLDVVPDPSGVGSVIDVKYVSHGPVMNTEISQFIKEMSEYPEIMPPLSLPIVESPLDLNCQEDCFIVFYLSGNWNWQFSTKGDCFTTKQNQNGKYSDLKHVMQGGDEIEGGQPVAEGCRLLYFRARCTPDKGWRDGFNLHVDLILGPGKRTSIIIDPDIRNPGGSGSGGGLL